MSTLNRIFIVLLTILSVAAGLAKVMQTTQEMEFLQHFGFDSNLIVAYGLVQMIGGVLLALRKTFAWGTMITIVAFSLSSFLIFTRGDISFGLMSTLPILLTAFVYWQSLKTKQQKAQNLEQTS